MSKEPAQKKLLEVGDTVYRLSRYTMTAEATFTIDRVTKTVAFAGKTQFKRDVNGGIVKLHPKTNWGSYTHRLPPPEPEVKESWDREIMVGKLKCIDFTTLPIEQLQQIVSIIENATK